MKKTLEFWTVTVTFNIRKGSYEAETKNQLRKNILYGIGKNDMENIEAEDIMIKIK